MSEVAFDELLRINADAVTTVIGPEIEFHGDLLTRDAEKVLLIHGLIKGSVHSAGPVVLSEGGRVFGSLIAPSAQIAGKIERTKDEDGVQIHETLVLSKSAQIVSDTVYGHLKMEHGAVIAGLAFPSTMLEAVTGRGLLKMKIRGGGSEAVAEHSAPSVGLPSNPFDVKSEQHFDAHITSDDLGVG